MATLLAHPTYFAPIDQFAALVNAEKIVFENEDNYQKQTYRNRQYIYGANGKLLINIPIKHPKKTVGHQKYKEVQIDNSFLWQRNHWRSIQTAYRTSPFFEFFEDDLAPLYEQSEKYLIDFNYRCLSVVADCLGIDLDFTKTDEYIAQPNQTDIRAFASAKRAPITELPAYAQVFEEKYGYIANLSILDLLFNEGRNSLTYLENLSLPY